MKAIIDIELDPAELMLAVFGDLYVASSPWCFKYRFNWEKPLARRVPVCYEDPSGEGDAWKYSHVGPDDLKRGFELMLKAGQHHCGELIPWDLEEWDTCCADECLQYTLFGESIFG